MTKASIRMNKSMWIGVAAGIATAGGVAAYSYLGEPSAALSAGAQEECWDEQVVTVADPTDRHRIAGTAIGPWWVALSARTSEIATSRRLWVPPQAR
jgi:uncharacterized protein YcfJ